jgi:hypothetical protein
MGRSTRIANWNSGESPPSSLVNRIFTRQSFHERFIGSVA